jgi:hypothetical protein
VLYYGDSAAGGVRASDYVRELGSRAEYDAFVGEGTGDNQLRVRRGRVRGWEGSGGSGVGRAAEGACQFDNHCLILIGRHPTPHPHPPNPDAAQVVNVALTSAAPCVKVFPAVLALAKNFVSALPCARPVLQPAVPAARAWACALHPLL